MNQLPNNLNGGSPSTPIHNGHSQAPNLSTQRKEAAIKQAKRWFVILLIVGLSLGGIVAVGVVKIMNELGLTERPTRPERIDSIGKPVLP
jgi:hypothetical protein